MNKESEGKSHIQELESFEAFIQAQIMLVVMLIVTNKGGVGGLNLIRIVELIFDTLNDLGNSKMSDQYGGTLRKDIEVFQCYLKARSAQLRTSFLNSLTKVSERLLSVAASPDEINNKVAALTPEAKAEFTKALTAAYMEMLAVSKFNIAEYKSAFSDTPENAVAVGQKINSARQEFYKKMAPLFKDLEEKKDR